MEQNEINFETICVNTIFCLDDLCQLDHSRIYVGICIEFLRLEQKSDDQDEFKLQKCNNINCLFWHFTLEKFKDQESKQTINGVYPHNLCRLSCKSKECRFLHRDWAMNVCFENILTKCKNKPEKCQFDHQNWKSLKEKGRAESVIQSITPEQLCIKENCNCSDHFPILKDYCVKYLKGVCPKKKCLKSHIDWEKINHQRNQSNCLKSCIVLAEERKQQIQSHENKGEVELLCQKQEIQYYQKIFTEKNIIDVLFIMDLTGSMTTWKEKVQDTISQIIEKFINSINGFQVRVAFIGYRDVCDADDKIIYTSFTKKIPEIQEFIRKQETKGGGDAAEDVVSGFEQALKLNFSHHPDSLLCTFLLADAPCHGRDYHNMISDDLIDQMPKNYFENVLEKYKNIKKHNFLICVKINDNTDMMFQKMKAVIPLLTITTQKYPKDLDDLVALTLQTSITESNKLKSQINNEFKYIKANFKKFRLDNLNLDYENKEYWKQFGKNLQVRQGTTGLKLTINKDDLNKDNNNTSTYIFKAFDAINNREVVIKIPKNLVDNNQKINDQDIQEIHQQAEIRFLSSSLLMQPLFYAHPILYEFDTPFYGLKKVYGETFIKNNYNFEKFTTNSCYSNPKKYFYSAFSHFSLSFTQELLVIMDLQGCNNIFTDPSIQTQNGWDSILNQDKTNHSSKGITDFKGIQHKQCSYLCQKLNLKPIQENETLNENKCPKDLMQNLYGICYDCDEFIEINLEKTNQLKNKKFSIKCDFCLHESQRPIEQVCKCCNYNYQTPMNQQMRTQTNLGYCPDCKNQCQLRTKVQCEYCKIYCQKHVKERQINNESHFICESAYKYLKAFSCKKCGKPYNYQTFISIENYNKQSFQCC